MNNNKLAIPWHLSHLCTRLPSKLFDMLVRKKHAQSAASAGLPHPSLEIISALIHPGHASRAPVTPHSPVVTPPYTQAAQQGGAGLQPQVLFSSAGGGQGGPMGISPVPRPSPMPHATAGAGGGGAGGLATGRAGSLEVIHEERGALVRTPPQVRPGFL